MGFGKDGKGAILRERTSVTVGGLAAGAVIKATAGIGGNLQEDFRILKTEYQIIQTGNWGAVGDQILIGVADNEMSVTEMAQCLTNDGPTDRNDRVSTEVSERPVWLLNHFVGESTTVLRQPAEDGKLMDMSLRWTFSDPEGWTWFAFNPLTGALTSGAVFLIQAKHYGVWVT